MPKNSWVIVKNALVIIHHHGCPTRRTVFSGAVSTGCWAAKNFAFLLLRLSKSHKACFLLMSSNTCWDVMYPLNSVCSFLYKSQPKSCSSQQWMNLHLNTATHSHGMEASSRCEGKAMSLLLNQGLSIHRWRCGCTHLWLDFTMVQSWLYKIRPCWMATEGGLSG